MSFELTSPQIEKRWTSLGKLFASNLMPHWATPKELYADLHREFNFDFDPCPLNGGADGLAVSWLERRVYCNPPYGHKDIEKWLSKAAEPELAAYLLPARTDCAWFHRWAPKAKEVRFIRGRLRFNESKTGAPFPSLLLIFEKGTP